MRGHMRLFTIAVGMCALLGASVGYAQIGAFEDPKSGSGGLNDAAIQELAPAEADIKGGTIPIGQTIQVIVMMRNNASTPIAIKEVNLAPSSNVTASISANQCGTENISPGIECPLTISIKAEMAGDYRVGILVDHTGRTKISSMAISGNITGSGASMPSNELEAFPEVLDFQKASGRAPLVRSISLRNTTSKTLDVKSIDLKASPLTGLSVSAPDCQSLAPSQSCVATVTWTPQVEGKSEGVLIMTHNGSSGSVQIPISGEYQRMATERAGTFPAPVAGRGLVISDRETIEFGSAIDGAASITVSLINAGDDLVTLKQVKLAGSDNGLSLSTDDCRDGKQLQPQEGCALTVNWMPRRTGPVIDDIQIIHDGARGVLILPVRGTATEPVNMSSPAIMPKISRVSLDEDLVGAESTGEKGGAHEAASLARAETLNGYRVTSLSADRAVITGPTGRIIVSNGVRHIIAGGSWTPHITPEGVEMTSGGEAVFLLFDSALKLNSEAGKASSFGGASSSAPATATLQSP